MCLLQYRGREAEARGMKVGEESKKRREKKSEFLQCCGISHVNALKSRCHILHVIALASTPCMVTGHNVTFTRDSSYMQLKFRYD